MLDSLQSQSMYRALKAAGGLHSPAGDKASATKDSIDSAISSMTSIADIPKNPSLDPITHLPAPVPPELVTAGVQIEAYKAELGIVGMTVDSLSSAISKRMSDATSNMAIMGTAAKISQNMGEVEGGCGPLGEAFSVLTSTGDSDAIRDLLALLPLDEILSLFQQAMDGGMTQAIRDALAAAMATMAELMGGIMGKNSLLGQLISGANAMWNDLESTFKHAVQTSVLMSILKNPCLQAAAEAIMPDSVKDAYSAYNSD